MNGYAHAVGVVVCLHVISLSPIIFQHRLGVLEGHAMLRFVGPRFLGIPLEVIVVYHHRLDRFFQAILVPLTVLIKATSGTSARHWQSLLKELPFVTDYLGASAYTYRDSGRKKRETLAVVLGATQRGKILDVVVRLSCST